MYAHFVAPPSLSEVSVFQVLKVKAANIRHMGIVNP